MKASRPTRRLLIGGAASLTALPAFAARPKHTHHHAKKTAVEDETDSASGVPPAPSPAATPIGPLDTSARWAYIIDFNTGAVLLEKNANERMTPSSLTKLMTGYIVFAMLKAGRLSLDQSLPVSEKAWRMQGSKMFVPLGESVSVHELIEGMLIQSGNDACIVLAEGIAGSEAQFATLMNQTAQRLGLTNSHFMNCTGWPAEGHYMSARDVTMLAAAIIRDFPDYYRFFGLKDYTFNKIHQGNRNVLVDKGIADGLKTGHTDAGGYGLCASDNRGGNRIIMTINGTPSSNARAHEGERLLSWAFANFENVKLLHKGQTVGSVPIWMGTSETVPLIATQDIVLTLPHGWQAHSHMAMDYRSPAVAPVQKGQAMGQLVLSNPGMTDIRINLVAGANVDRLGLVGRAMTRLGRHPASHG